LLSWRGNCHVQDAAINTGRFGVRDLSGGFHDAGDHVKFQLPISFSKVTLGWAVYEYRDEFIRVDSLGHAQRILDHYADFLRRCIIWNSNGTIHAFAYQVGDGEGGGGSGNTHDDHAYWGRPERQTGTTLNGAQRRAYFTDLTTANPGTEQVAIAAAVLAQNFVNFGNTADRDAALALFQWADARSKGLARRGVSTDGGAGRNFYRSQRWEDKLALAGEWLNIAYNTTTYRRTTTLPNSNWAYSWDNVWAQVGVLRQDWTAVDRELNTTRIDRNNPNTYSIWQGWGNARYNAAMQGVALARDNRRSQTTYSPWARGQMTFLLGGNPQRNSYVIGYPSIAASAPSLSDADIRVHHRASHVPASQTGSNFTIHNNNSRNSNILIGALVGGPGTTAGTFDNRVNHHEHTEVTCDYNASLALAAAGHLRQHSTHQPVSRATIFGSQSFRNIASAATAPVITSANTLTVQRNTAGSLPLTASGTAPITFAIVGTAPAGVSINGSTLTVGTNAPLGTHTFTISATNTVGNNQQVFTLNIVTPPVNIVFNWNPTRTPPDRNIANGATDHVKILSGVEITPCIIAMNADAALRVNYTAAGNNSSRRLIAWTNLSGSASNINSIAFLTTNNFADNVVLSDQILEGAASVTVTIPRHLLSNGSNTADRIYIAIGTNTGPTDNRYTLAANHRGGGTDNEIATRFQSVTLTTTATQAPTNPAACSSCSNLPCRCVGSPVNPTVTWPMGLTATSTQTLGQINLPSNTGTAGTFSWTAGNNTPVGAVGSRIHNLTFTPSDTASFLTVSNNVTVTVTAPNSWVWCLSQATQADVSDGHNAHDVVFSRWGGNTGIALNTSPQNSLAVAPRSGTSDSAVFNFARAGMNITQNTYRISMTGSFTNPNAGTNLRIQGILGGPGTSSAVAQAVQLPNRVHNIPLTGNNFSFEFTVGVNGEVSFGPYSAGGLSGNLTAIRLQTNADGANASMTFNTFRVTMEGGSQPTEFPVTIQSGLTGISLQGGPQFSAGQTVTLNITPPAGQRLAANGITATGAALTNAAGATQVTFTMPSNAVTITGRNFQAIPDVTVTLDLGGGNTTTVTFQQGTVPSIPEPVRSGFIFDGWGDTDFTNITSNTTIAAEWLRLGAIVSSGTGNVTSADLTWLARHAANHPGFTFADDRARRVADISGTGGNVTFYDVTMLARWLIGYNIDDLRNGL
jgi:hypothetical protein